MLTFHLRMIDRLNKTVLLRPKLLFTFLNIINHSLFYLTTAKIKDGNVFSELVVVARATRNKKYFKYFRYYILLIISVFKNFKNFLASHENRTEEIRKKEQPVFLSASRKGLLQALIPLK